jgi:hypothetical protein
MLKTLRGKRIFAVLILFLVILIVWIAVKIFDRGKVNTEDDFGKNDVTDTLNQDSDGDGLTDWEEVLWKTDPNNPDSDGDGKLDGEEIVLNTNPTIAGPDDGLATEESVAQADSSSFFLNQNYTELFSQDLFLQYLQMKSEGHELDTETLNNLISGVSKDLFSGIKEVSYTPADILIIQNNDLSAIRKYGNEMSEIINENAADLGGVSEAVLLNEALRDRDREKMKGLEPFVYSYNKILTDSLSVPVPSSATDIQLTILNGYRDLAHGVLAMRGGLDDPIRALQGLSLYTRSVDTLTTGFRDLKNYFNTNGLVFEKNEPGYIFVSGIL